ncbi:MAG: type II toxin-antitoxin system HicA family toxin [Flavobacteriaceae bacterium]|nr:type II toxin-antitoxin system HicA family toxin [Flavobacteriaceae bacterium]MCI5087789.1 type II toxin-antitoxin system HicA family toxin [Flavobacteriaceae bacterium]
MARINQNFKYYGYQEITSGKTSDSRIKFKNKTGPIITLHKPHPSPVVKTYIIKQLIAHLK